MIQYTHLSQNVAHWIWFPWIINTLFWTHTRSGPMAYWAHISFHLVPSPCHIISRCGTQHAKAAQITGSTDLIAIAFPPRECKTLLQRKDKHTHTPTHTCWFRKTVHLFALNAITLHSPDSCWCWPRYAFAQWAELKAVSKPAPLGRSDTSPL